MTVTDLTFAPTLALITASTLLAGCGATGAKPATRTHAATSPTQIVPWHRIGGIGFDMTRTVVEYQYGQSLNAANSGILIYRGLGRLGRGGHGRIGVSYDSHNRVNALDTKSPKYATASGLRVGATIPLGRCQKVSQKIVKEFLLPKDHCAYRWRNFVFKANQDFTPSGIRYYGEWDGYVHYKGAFFSNIELFETKGRITEIWIARVRNCPGGGGTTEEAC